MLKLVIHDVEHAAGLFLDGHGSMRQLLTELKAVPDTSSASLLLEELALRCLERGWGFVPADPLVHGCAAKVPIVEIHLDHRLPGTPFVSLHQPGANGGPYRWLHGTLDGLVRRLRLLPSAAVPACSSQPKSPNRNCLDRALPPVERLRRADKGTPPGARFQAT